MTLEEFQQLMEPFWDRVEREADRSKDSQVALNRLQSLYEGFDDAERRLADQVFIEWAEAGDTRRRFAALAMIDRFGIRSALPTLRRLAGRLERSEEPSGPYDWAKVNRIIGRLSEK